MSIPIPTSHGGFQQVMGIISPILGPGHAGQHSLGRLRGPRWLPKHLLPLRPITKSVGILVTVGFMVMIQ